MGLAGRQENWWLWGKQMPCGWLVHKSGLMGCLPRQALKTQTELTTSQLGKRNPIKFFKSCCNSSHESSSPKKSSFLKPFAHCNECDLMDGKWMNFNFPFIVNETTIGIHFSSNFLHFIPIGLTSYLIIVVMWPLLWFCLPSTSCFPKSLFKNS